MPFVATKNLKVIELPGWRGRYFHSAGMTFAHYEFAAGSSIHDGCSQAQWQRRLASQSAIFRRWSPRVHPQSLRKPLPQDGSAHSVKALTDGRLIVVDHPARPEFV